MSDMASVSSIDDGLKFTSGSESPGDSDDSFGMRGKTYIDKPNDNDESKGESSDEVHLISLRSSIRTILRNLPVFLQDRAPKDTWEPLLEFINMDHKRCQVEVYEDAILE